MKHNRYNLPFLILVTLLLTACEDRYSGWLVVDGAHHLTPQETLEGELIQFDGAVTVAHGARITGSVYMLEGELYLDGVVDGDISLIDGQLILGPTATVAGRVNRAGGQITGIEQAKIAGGVHEGAGLEIPIELTRTRRSPRDALLQSLAGGFVLGLAAAAVVRFLPHALGRISHAATRHALVSSSLGLLVAVVGPAAAVAMAFTIVLVPLAFLALLAGAFVIAYGWIALGVALGNRLAAHLPNRPGLSLTAFLGTWLFMLLLGLLNLIPVAGSFLALVVTLITLGAVLLTRFGSHTFIPATHPAQPLPSQHEAPW